jgi:hypothetical protein
MGSQAGELKLWQEQHRKDLQQHACSSEGDANTLWGIYSSTNAATLQLCRVLCGVQSHNMCQQCLTGLAAAAAGATRVLTRLH